MNRRTSISVEAASPGPRLRVIWIAALWAAIGSAGCVEIDGGAVELSWSLRSFEGNSVGNCGDVGISRMQICWQSLEDDQPLDTLACLSEHSADFPCSEANGTSGFTIDPGRTAFWLEPLCENAQPPAPESYQVPPPITRQVEEGRIVTLDSLLVVVAPQGEPCPDVGCTCFP